MFIWSAFAHLIALTSPGPDTAIVIRQVSIHGRIEGIKTAIGIGFGILVHCILAISGISLLILANDLYKFIISLIGGMYILYLGVTMYSSIKNELPNNNNFLNIKNKNLLAYNCQKSIIIVCIKFIELLSHLLKIPPMDMICRSLEKLKLNHTIIFFITIS